MAAKSQAQRSRVLVVTGKGGVGKTACATAIGLALAQRGNRVLVAEINGGGSVAQMLGTSPVGSQVREICPDFSVVDINPTSALREYALLTLRVEAIYRTVFDNRWVRRFLRLVPSLGELVMLGKIWYHAQEQLAGCPRFDAIVVDAPATGHAMALLRAPLAAAEAVPAGPLRSNALLIQELLGDPERTKIHIVTTPEEMPVSEAIELADSIHSLGLSLGRPLINQRIPPLPSAAWEALGEDGDQDPCLRRCRESLRAREAKRIAGERHLRRLPQDFRDAISLPRLITPTFGHKELRELARTHLLPWVTEQSL